MAVPQVRFGDWLKHEEGYSPIDKVLCVEVVPQGDSNHPATKDTDAFFVEVTLIWQDVSLPPKLEWERSTKYLELSDYLKLEVFRGTGAECEEIITQIIGNASDGGGSGQGGSS